MNLMLTRSGVVAICWYFTAIHSALGAVDARFVPINAFEVSGISADGTIVAGETVGGAFLWTEAGGIETLPLPAGYRIFSVTNLSGDGTTIVGGLQIGSGFSQRYEGFRWTREGGYQPLGRFSTDWLDWAFATDVSYDGSVVVGTNDTPNGRRAFHWTQQTGQVDLGTLGSSNPIYPPFSEGEAVSADGKTVVGFVTTTQDEFYKAYRWTKSDGFDVIGLPPGTGNTAAGGATAISGDGLVMAGHSQWNGWETWTWTEPTGFSILPTEGNDKTVSVSSMSFDGSTLVGSQIVWNQPTPTGVIYNAVLWRKRASGYQLSLVEDVLEEAGVSLAGWHLNGAWDVSYDGRVLIGTGIDPRGVQRSWYAVLPVLEPTSLVYAWTALGGVLIVRRRARGPGEEPEGARRIETTSPVSVP
jgi:probable HAF family extracellular repeat protein